jgi:hypothetical protein
MEPGFATRTTGDFPWQRRTLGRGRCWRVKQDEPSVLHNVTHIAPCYRCVGRVFVLPTKLPRLHPVRESACKSRMDERPGDVFGSLAAGAFGAGVVSIVLSEPKMPRPTVRVDPDWRFWCLTSWQAKAGHAQEEK